MTKKSSIPEISNGELAAIYVAALADGKKFYKQADLALDQLLTQAKVGELITLPTAKPIPVDLRGKKFQIEDKFAKKNSIGVGQSARRYELKELKQP